MGHPPHGLADPAAAAPQWANGSAVTVCPALRFIDPESWGRIHAPGLSKLKGRQNVWVYPEVGALYMENQKAATEYLYANLPYFLSNNSSRPLQFVHQIIPFPWTGSHRPCCNGLRRFTFVTNPVKCALRAYGEISRRINYELPGGKSLRPSPRYRLVPCTNASLILHRLGLFLDDVEAGTALGGQAFHAFPQVLKTFVHLDALAFTGRIEHLIEDATKWRNLLHLPAKVEHADTLVQEVVSNFKANGSQGTTMDACVPEVNELDEQTLMRLCRIYFVDVLCLGYQLAPNCQEAARQELHRRQQLKGLLDA